MKKLLLSIILGLISTVFCYCQPVNTNLSNTLLFEGEPYLVINPVNHQNIVVAWMALDASTGYRVSIKSKTSFDGGVTWGHPFIQPHFGKTWYSADVSMQFCNNGMLSLSYIDYHQAPDSGGVYIAHSADGGITWSAPTQIWNGMTEDPSKRPLDRPWLVIDNSGTSNDGMFYLTTKPAPWIYPPNRPYLKTSSDSGQTWSSYRYVDTTGYLVGNLIAAPMPAPAVTADGALCIAYPSYVASQSVYPKIYLAKSYNRGASFQYHDLLVNPSSVQDTLYKLGYHLTANPNNANQLAYAYIAKPYGDPDVFITTSNNGGVSWNSPVRVNDDATSNGVAQDMVWASYNNENKLLVTWRDRRNGTGTGFYQPSDSYCAVSLDNGITFQSNIRLSNITAPFDSILEQNGNDFLSCEFYNDTIYAAWGDVRTGNLNIFFTKTSANTGNGIPAINIEDEQPFLVYPNPCRDKLFISFPENKSALSEIRIFNENKQEVWSQKVKNKTAQISVDVSQFAKGIYMVQVINEKGKSDSQKVVVK
jgi:hypothetical protein